MNPSAVARARFWVRPRSSLDSKTVKEKSDGEHLIRHRNKRREKCTAFFEDGSRILCIFDVCHLKLMTALNSRWKRGITADCSFVAIVSNHSVRSLSSIPGSVVLIMHSHRHRKKSGWLPIGFNLFESSRDLS